VFSIRVALNLGSSELWQSSIAYRKRQPSSIVTSKVIANLREHKPARVDIMNNRGREERERADEVARPHKRKPAKDLTGLST
jgi:hypothetical protein